MDKSTILLNEIGSLREENKILKEALEKWMSAFEQMQKCLIDSRNEFNSLKELSESLYNKLEEYKKAEEQTWKKISFQ